VFCLGIGLALTAGASLARTRQVRIKWPSREFRDLQSALDAAPDNAIIEIKAGIYQIDQPLIVSGKKVVIRGAGAAFSGEYSRTPTTHLIGPSPHEVVDERGNVVLRAEAVQGLWNFIAADVVIEDMNLTGFDAGIVARPDDRGESGPTQVRNVVISGTGRGILSTAPADLSVEQCRISDTKWNGISFAPKFTFPGPLPVLNVTGTVLVEPEGAGIYFENAIAFVSDVDVLSAETGGVVGVASTSFIDHSNFIGNHKAGLLLAGGFSDIEDNTILGTQASLQGTLGDGITLWSLNEQMQADVQDNLIMTSHRAGVSSFGAWVDLADNDIFCATFDLFGTDFDSFVFELNDLSGNECGCGQVGPCAATGDGLEPPPPVGGLE
jgi:hypothetical protein